MKLTELGEERTRSNKEKGKYYWGRTSAVLLEACLNIDISRVTRSLFVGHQPYY